MILSFHPLIVGDKNIICAGRDPGEAELAAIKEARAVLLPQGCRETLYRMARENAPQVFPNYDARFRYPGKTGQAEMFADFSAPFPSTRAYRSVSAFDDEGKAPPFGFPFVFKNDWGGEGSGVRLIRDQTGLGEALRRACEAEKGGDFGFILQEYVPCGSRSLRVTVIHRQLVSYWRVGRPGEPLMGGLSRGAEIDFEADPQLVAQAERLVRDLCGKTGIDLAGFDLIFPENGGGPLFLEVNWFFGRRGLGGSTGYYKILGKNVRAWIGGLK
ncbi:MAG: glutathione synthase [Deltaproteobacteria bacterium]|nr:glutathione synthase [Deltaproteobacteria bacterium]